MIVQRADDDSLLVRHSTEDTSYGYTSKTVRSTKTQTRRDPETRLILISTIYMKTLFFYKKN